MVKDTNLVEEEILPRVKSLYVHQQIKLRTLIRKKELNVLKKRQRKRKNQTQIRSQM
jgi:hypothetical protein